MALTKGSVKKDQFGFEKRSPRNGFFNQETQKHNILTYKWVICGLFCTKGRVVIDHLGPWAPRRKEAQR